MSLFASYAKLKRKTFWVMRYVEVTSEVNTIMIILGNIGL